MCVCMCPCACEQVNVCVCVHVSLCVRTSAYACVCAGVRIMWALARSCSIPRACGGGEYHFPTTLLLSWSVSLVSALVASACLDQGIWYCITWEQAALVVVHPQGLCNPCVALCPYRNGLCFSSMMLLERAGALAATAELADVCTGVTAHLRDLAEGAPDRTPRIAAARWNPVKYRYKAEAGASGC